MIIWINGAFGSGKTQTSFELHRRIPNSFVYDPENAGYYIRKNIPIETSKGDFQNYSMWREFNYAMLKYISSEYDGTVIVPMTVVNPSFFEEIIGRLRDDDVIVHHFTLCASRETLQKRLRGRGERKGCWAEQQIDRCISGLSNDVFKHHLDTEHMPIDEVVATVASMLDLTLPLDNHGKLRKKYDRLKTQIRHLRFFN